MSRRRRREKTGPAPERVLEEVSNPAPQTIADRIENQPGLLTVNQLAALLGVHPQTVYKDAKSNRIPSVRYRGIRFDPVYIARWLRERTTK